MRNRNKIILISVSVIAVIGLITGIFFYIDLREIACHSGADLVAPTKSGVGILNTESPGACFATKVEIKEGDTIIITERLCKDQLTFDECTGWTNEIQESWQNIWRTKCVSLSFFGDAECSDDDMGGVTKRGALLDQK